MAGTLHYYKIQRLKKNAGEVDADDVERTTATRNWKRKRTIAATAIVVAVVERRESERKAPVEEAAAGLRRRRDC